MDVVLKYRGRVIREADVAVIRALIQEHATASRRELSQQLCKVWNWVQPNGALRDMVCRGLMLALERAGHIVLPPVRQRPPNPLAMRRRPERPEIDATPIAGGLKDLGPLEFRLVRRTPKHSSIHNGGGEPATVRRTGSRWDLRRAAEKHRTVIGPIGRSNRCWPIRSTNASGIYLGTCERRQDQHHPDACPSRRTASQRSSHLARRAVHVRTAGDDH